MPGRRSSPFPTTAWGLLRAAQDHDDPERLAALNRLIGGYWRPVFYFLRAKGHPLHEAEDLAQEFFGRLLERDWLARADQRRGRFRNFLLAILVRFVADQYGHRARRQARFERQMVAVSALVGEGERVFEPSGGPTPEEIFMRRWAEAVVENVRHGVESWCRDQGRPDWFQLFAAAHFPTPGGKRPSQRTLAEQFRLTRDQVRYALETANERFVELLRAEVAGQVGSRADIETEIHELDTLLHAT